MENTKINEVEIQALAIQNELSAIVITDQASYSDAVEALQGAKKRLDAIGEFFEDLRKPAYDSYQAILDKRARVTKPLETAITSLKNAISGFVQEQRRIEQEKQRQAEREAQERAEKERLEKAQYLEDAGADKELVESVLQEPVAIVPVKVEPTFTPSSGATLRETTAAEVTDLLALVKHVAKHKEDLRLLKVDQSALNALARSRGEHLSIPGVRVFKKSNVAVR